LFVKDENIVSENLNSQEKEQILGGGALVSKNTKEQHGKKQITDEPAAEEAGSSNKPEANKTHDVHINLKVKSQDGNEVNLISLRMHQKSFCVENFH
jgi:hypothetical protein